MSLEQWQIDFLGSIFQTDKAFNVNISLSNYLISPGQVIVHPCMYIMYSAVFDPLASLLLKS